LDITDGLGPGSVTLLKTQTEAGILFMLPKIDSILFHSLSFLLSCRCSASHPAKVEGRESLVIVDAISKAWFVGLFRLKAAI
jgi:hypothetical protein